MGKKLAIKGHVSRGKEVIELFKMMGGCECGYCGGGTDFYYYISQFGNIESSCKPTEFDTYIVYTLEEFLEKFPYKVGDKVYIYIQNDDIDGRYDIEVAEITSMRWNPARCKIAYKMKDINREFYKEEIKCKVDDDSNKNKSDFIIKHMILPNKMDDKLEYKIIDGYEFDKVENNKIILKPIKSKYPTTYVECCEVLGIGSYFEPEIRNATTEECYKFTKLMRLKRCCNAYWKIYGEELGLGKPWEPDWKKHDKKYIISVFEDAVIYFENETYNRNAILAFPTEEMRDAFYENFKELIEQCKELL